MALYELIILGSPKPKQVVSITKAIKEVAKDFELDFPQDIAVLTSTQFADHELKACSTALYFGGTITTDSQIISTLEAEKVPIIPIVQQGDSFGSSIPSSISATNAYFVSTGDPHLKALAALSCESLGLLRKQRRVFISYRRMDSREVAVQLFDQLSARGFDVFLDTHDIRPGEPFQEVLWHRLVDSDVVIMLDTTNYFASKWTKQELGRALLKRIHILRLVWPNHKASRHLSLSETITLKRRDISADKTLTDGIVDLVIARTERLRSRSIATRHLEINGKLRIEVERMGGTFEGIGLHRSAALTLPNGLKVQAYPVVGVPSAETLNDIHSKAKTAGKHDTPCLVYDDLGIRDLWLKHLGWLSSNITCVRSLKVSNASWELAQWDS
ncbi:MAG: toll/interleukin-1 receptor domain-containing protein [Hyphomicrobium sp.]|nr:toll/interleukin-1 receptor domain-containing protein [Hyphomicrobium sp.]